jgi:hypothetical protein
MNTPLAIVRVADGKVVTFVRPDQPEGWRPPEGTVAVLETDLPPDWERAEEPQGAPITAEEAVAAFFTPFQTIALQRLELALMSAGKPLGPAMTAAKSWLEGVMLSWASDPTPAPAASFGQPQTTFEQASAEAVNDLLSDL